MKKKWLSTLGASLTAMMLVTGCANEEQEPPPEDDMNVEDPVMEDETDGRGGNGNPDDNNTEDTNDVNKDGDGDAGVDNNTAGEEGIEDESDIIDNNNEDK